MAIKSVELENSEQRYKLYFLKKAYDKMSLYVELCPDEIGWLGYVDKLKDGQGYLITDVFLVDQEVHGATTELSPDAIVKYYNGLDEAGREEFLNKCKIWGHSHVNMAPNPSGQDDTQGLELSKDVDDFYIRLITNKKNEYHITFYDKTIKAKIITDEIVLYNPEGVELRKAIQEEINEKVKKKTFSIPITSKPAYSYSNYKYCNSAVSKSIAKKLEISKINIDDVFDKPDYHISLFKKLRA